MAHVPLSPLYMNDYAGFLSDEIVHRSRDRKLTTNDVVYAQDRIASANRHGKISNREAENLLDELNHFAHGTPMRLRSFRKKRRSSKRKRRYSKSKRTYGSK